MDKPPTVNPKKAKKEPKTKTKSQPLKVVYITNPIKFTATTSEFRALVQELTGQDADVSGLSRFEASSDSVGGHDTEELKVAAAEDNVVHAIVEEEVGQTDEDLLQKRSDFSTFGLYDIDDAFYCPEIMEWLASRNMRNQDEINLDVFKRLDAM